MRGETAGPTRSSYPLLLLASSLVAGTFAVVAHSAAPAGSARLEGLPVSQLAKCRTAAALRSVCPRRVPQVNGGYRALFARDGKLTPALYVFDLERFSMPLRPPNGAHITAAAGAVWRLTPYEDPAAQSKAKRLSEPVSPARMKPVSFGVRDWNGRRGILYLAPPYLHGGQLGDHLVFQWGTGDRMHVISLHRWSPLSETAAMLRAMVMALA